MVKILPILCIKLLALAHGEVSLIVHQVVALLKLGSELLGGAFAKMKTIPLPPQKKIASLNS